MATGSQEEQDSDKHKGTDQTPVCSGSCLQHPVNPHPPHTHTAPAQVPPQGRPCSLLGPHSSEPFHILSRYLQHCLLSAPSTQQLAPTCLLSPPTRLHIPTSHHLWGREAAELGEMGHMKANQIQKNSALLYLLGTLARDTAPLT